MESGVDLSRPKRAKINKPKEDICTGGDDGEVAVGESEATLTLNEYPDEVVVRKISPGEMRFSDDSLRADRSSTEMDDDGGSPDCSITSMTQGKKDKTCLVCGDKALGYNFNAVSCESCKAFFRRNAHKTIRGRCEGKCDVNIESRSFCKKCRLAKCFNVGMKKDMILNDEQKQVRKQKIIINKLRKQGQLPPEDTYAASERDLNDTVQDNLKSQSFHELRTTFPNLSDADIRALMNLQSGKKGNSSPEPYKYPSWNDSQEVVADLISELPEIDQCILNELRTAHEQSSFLASTQTNLKHSPTNPTEFVNVAEGFVRRIIKVAKNIEFFKMICKDDQIALLKGAVVEILMLRSAVNYDIHTETWSLNTMKCLTKGAGPILGTPPSNSNSKSPASSATSTSLQNSVSPCNSNPVTASNYTADQVQNMVHSSGIDIEKLRALGQKGGSHVALPTSQGPSEMNTESSSAGTLQIGNTTETLQEIAKSSGQSIDALKLKARAVGLDIQKLTAKRNEMVDKAKELAKSTGQDVEALRNMARAAGFDVDKLREIFTGSSSAPSEGRASDGASGDGEVRISADLLLKGNPESQTMFLTYSKFIKSLMRTIHGDLLVLKLMIMLSLFSADRTGIKEHDKIREIQECYAGILQKYIELRFKEEKNMFARIIMKLTDLRNINEVHTKMLLRMKMDNIEPLLLEIFDLQP